MKITMPIDKLGKCEECELTLDVRTIEFEYARVSLCELCREDLIRKLISSAPDEPDAGEW